MADIRKRTGKNGTTYQVRYPTTKTKSGYAYATFDTRKEALDFRDRSATRRSAHQPHAEIRTVAEGLQKWLDVCEKEGRDGRDPVTSACVKNYEWRRDLILAYDWRKPLHDLTPPDIVEFRSWLVLNYSQDLARRLLSSFHSMVLELVKRGVLAHDIAAGISIRGQSRYDQEVAIPTEKEIGDLLVTADRLANSKNLQIQKSWERYRPMLYLAVDTGMRPQEYVAIPDFNIRDGGVQVDRAVEAGSKKLSVTKTPAGRRFIELSPHVREMVLNYSANHGVEKNPHSLVFPTASGRWQTVNNWYRRGFCYVCEKAALLTLNADGEETHKYTPYSLRHFYASMLIEQKVNLKRIQRLMGHTSIETTLNVYGHLIERKEAAAEDRNGMLASLSQIPCGKVVATGSQAAEIGQ